MLTLYGVYRSRASRPLWLLEEIGAEFAHVPVIQAYRLASASAADAPLNTASPDYLAVNPLGQIPCLDDDGLILTESLAITLHLARILDSDFGPQSEAEDAQMIQWTLLAATGIEAPALEIQIVQGNGGADTPEGRGAIAIAAEKLRRPLDRLDKHFADRDWLVGDRFTVADLNVAECLRYAQGHQPLFDAHPALAAWLARCQARPAFQAMWARRDQEAA